VGASRPAAEIVAPILGWDEDIIHNEVEHYRQRVEAERASQTMPDDEAADRARLRAPDING
jgi:glycerol-3-phosphate dehydrogenase